MISHPFKTNPSSFHKILPSLSFSVSPALLFRFLYDFLDKIREKKIVKGEKKNNKSSTDSLQHWLHLFYVLNKQNRRFFEYGECDNTLSSRVINMETWEEANKNVSKDKQLLLRKKKVICYVKKHTYNRKSMKSDCNPKWHKNEIEKRQYDIETKKYARNTAINRKMITKILEKKRSKCANKAYEFSIQIGSTFMEE